MIYVDMDGVLAIWDTSVTEADTHKPGYFRKREAQKNVVEAVLILHRMNRKVTVLSHVYTDGTAREDKKVWLKENNLEDVPAIFVPYGTSKSSYLEKIGRGDVLLDDYSRNLREWEKAGAKAVKFLNGINGTKGTWRGQSVNREMSPEKIVQILICVADG